MRVPNTRTRCKTTPTFPEPALLLRSTEDGKGVV